jgi:hypothetical protein
MLIVVKSCSLVSNMLRIMWAYILCEIALLLQCPQGKQTNKQVIKKRIQ